MLQTFIDDSGKAEEPFFVLAGFTSLVERWVEFANAWKLKLQEPPKIRYFKMREAAALRGEFLNFTERQRDRRLEDLIGIINAHASFFVFCEVNRDAWKQAFQKQISKTLDSPYYHAYCSIMQSPLIECLCTWCNAIALILYLTMKARPSYAKSLIGG